MFRLIKKYLGEFVVVFALIFSINNYFGNETELIKADGVGYYDYLPALFIHDDFPDAFKKDVSERIKKTQVYVSYKEHTLNKYPCGTAVLLFPFFVYAHLTSSIQGFINDGYSLPYQKAVFYGAVFYLFFALVFLKRLLLLYNTKIPTIFFIQFIIVFSTSIINYVNSEPSFSHVYSFFAITAFLYFVKTYIISKKQNDFLWACVFFGLIIILRQVNVIIIFFIPFLAGSVFVLKSIIIDLFKNKWLLFKGFLLSFIIISIQLYLWYKQTGELFVFSYQGESFNFLNPAFFEILFSYKKGLFVYTPILFVTLFGLIFYIKKKQIYLFATWLLFFILLTYVLSSWWSWFYGCSYGLRAYIDFYAVFCILMAVFLDSAKHWLKGLVVSLMLLTIPVNMIQTLQYKEYILHWINMDKQKYWLVFLETKDTFKGLLWKKEFYFNTSNITTLDSSIIGDKNILINSSEKIYSEEATNISNFEKINIIQVNLDNQFWDEDDSYIELSILNPKTEEVFYNHKVPLIHFSERGLNMYHSGVFNFEVPTLTAENKIVQLKSNANNTNVELKNVRINYIRYTP